jgi:serine/threonine protein phosphatase 1
LPARALVIGDIHGCAAQLDALLEGVVPSLDDHFVFLGDLIDRGPDSAGVIKRVLGLSKIAHVAVIMGNHEQMMLAARESHDKHSDWIRNGGDATLRSYAGVRGSLRDVPAEHWRFLEEGLVQYVETDTHIFVHANAYPDLPMDEQPDYMLRWERCDKIAAHQSGKEIVCGHTPQKSGRPMNRGYAICIDTHAYGGGALTCLDANSGRVWQANAGGRVQRGHISDFSDE